MKVIIYRDKETKKIVRDGGNDYERLKATGKEIDALGMVVALAENNGYIPKRKVKSKFVQLDMFDKF